MLKICHVRSMSRFVFVELKCCADHKASCMIVLYTSLTIIYKFIISHLFMVTLSCIHVQFSDFFFVAAGSNHDRQYGARLLKLAEEIMNGTGAAQ